VAGCFELKKKAGRAWAAEHSVPYVDSPEALNRHVDAFMILASSNPGVHLDLCREVFPFGKPTYVDKTFTPDLTTAKTIFRLDDRHKVPMQTTSALRYTNVQEYVREVGCTRVRHMVTWGGGVYVRRICHPSGGTDRELHGP
jgi:predicted dehydrogenase